MPDLLTLVGWLGCSFSVRTRGMPASEGVREGVGEAEGDAVGATVGADEISGCGSVTLCAESWLSSFHCPPSLRRLQMMPNRGVPVWATKETSTVAVAVVPITWSTVREWMVEPFMS